MSKSDLDTLLPKLLRQESCSVDANARTGTITSQWFLENDIATHPITNNNQLQFMVCGDEAFSALEADISKATSTIDLVLWGFDPAMELARMTPTVDPKQDGFQYWPRGTTFGDLLAQKAAGGVQVRLLLWYDSGRDEAIDSVIQMLLGNEKSAVMDLARSAFRQVWQKEVVKNAPDLPWSWKPMPGFGDELRRAPHVQQRNAKATSKDLRTEYARAWWHAALSGEISGLEVRMRKANPNSIAALKSEYLPTALSAAEELGINHIGTHHQKPVLIDYHPGQGSYQGADKAEPNTCGYVMGLNSVTDYWDSEHHIYNDPRRETAYGVGAAWLKPWHLKPYRDYAMRVQGEALGALNKNFCEAWDQADKTHVHFGGGALLAKRASVQPKPVGAHRAQIVRTQPEHGDATILKTYTLASAKAVNYIYLENQYVQLADWVKFVKNQREKVVKGYAAGCKATLARQPDLKLPTTVAPLFLFVVMPQAERDQMVPATYETLAQMGQATTVRGYHADVQDLKDGKKNQFNALQQSILKDTLAATPGTSEIAEELKKLQIKTLTAMLMTYDYANEAGDLRINQRDNAAQEAQAVQEAKTNPAHRAADVDPGTHSQYNIKPQRYREIYVHSKLMLVDDCFITLGSANLNKRSMVGDSELNIASAEHLLAKGARQRVWSNLAGPDLSGGDGSPLAVKQAFDDWTTRAANNAGYRKSPTPQSPDQNSFIHTYDDPRGTPMLRLA